jgi:hypothetical protein
MKANIMERRVSCRDWRGSIDLVSNMRPQNLAKNIGRHVFFHLVAVGLAKRVCGSTRLQPVETRVPFKLDPNITSLY